MSAISPASSAGSTTSPRSASTPSGFRRSSRRRWPTSATTSPTIATSIRSSARSRISTRWSTEAHALGLKVIIDQVLSHTSDKHPWFSESRREPHQPARRLVRLGRSQARRHAAQQLAVDLRRLGLGMGAAPPQYYLHNFLVEQPDLNFHNPAGAGRAARRPALLAGARRRRLPPRHRQLLLPRQAAAQQSAEARRAAQRPTAPPDQPLRATRTTSTTRRGPKTSPSSSGLRALIDAIPAA